MKMFALVTDAFGGEGGIAQYNRDLLMAFSKVHPHSRIVVLPRRIAKHVQHLPPNVFQKGSQSNRIHYALDALISLMREGPFDILFCGHLHLAPLAGILSFMFRIPVWLQIHGIDAWKRPSAFCRWSVQRTALITSVSRYTRRHFLGWANVPPQRVQILPNTFQTVFRPGPKPEYLAKKYGLEGKSVLLTVGRLSNAERYKGVDEVISVLPDLLEQHPDLVYFIAGPGDDVPRLEALATAKGVQKNVIFTGKVHHEVLPDLYRIADVFVMPSRGEGFGIVFLEAMASGIPVVGGDKDGSVDPLHEGMLGATVPCAKLFEAIKNALSGKARKGVELSMLVNHHFGVTPFTKHVGKLSRMCVSAVPDRHGKTCGTWSV